MRGSPTAHVKTHIIQDSQSTDSEAPVPGAGAEGEALPDELLVEEPPLCELVGVGV